MLLAALTAACATEKNNFCAGAASGAESGRLQGRKTLSDRQHLVLSQGTAGLRRDRPSPPGMGPVSMAGPPRTAKSTMPAISPRHTARFRCLSTCVLQISTTASRSSCGSTIVDLMRRDVLSTCRNRRQSFWAFTTRGTARVRVTYVARATQPDGEPLQANDTPPEIASAVPAAPTPDVAIDKLPAVPDAPGSAAATCRFVA